MTYRAKGWQPTKRHRGLRRVFGGFFLAVFILACVAGGVGWHQYKAGLEPVGGAKTASVVIAQGDSVSAIAAKLKQAGLIQSTRSFEYYARLHKTSQYLQAGTYNIAASQSVPEIITQLTHGKVATSLVTIVPGQRLDQIRQSLIDQGFSAPDVDAALQPAQYANSPVLASKPAGANLEGYLYPDSFQRTEATTAKAIVEQSMLQLHKHLTPELVARLQAQGLSVYQGLILASIVTKEVTNPTDRAQAAQVFIKRFKIGMPLGSDVTAYYGSQLAGKGKDVTYDTPYNTRLHTGLPPTPISNVDLSALRAVAEPANTDWLFFVSGDNGTTYFSKTQAEHEALAAKYCHKLCEE